MAGSSVIYTIDKLIKVDFEFSATFPIQSGSDLLTFLLIDKIMEITEDGIIGVKNVTKNEPYFQGHFPGNPVMPGVLQIEAMAQTGGVFSLSKVEDPHLYSTYFMKIDNVKFKRKVIPGDTIVFDLKLISPIRRGLVHMGGKGYVNNQVCIEAEMLAQVVKDRG